MFEIAICDDQQVAIQIIESILLKNQKSLKIELSIDKFQNGEDLLKAMAKGNKYQLIFLDIEMNEMDGITVGNEIRTALEDYETNIIIVSAKSQYALRAYDIMPLGFILKPAKEERVILELKKALKLYESKEKYITYSINRDKHRIFCKDIYYIESNKKEVIVYLKEGYIKFYKTLTELEEETKNHGFYRISKSIIVNERYIVSIEGLTLTLKNTTKLTAGKTYVENLFELFK